MPEQAWKHFCDYRLTVMKAMTPTGVRDVLLGLCIRCEKLVPLRRRGLSVLARAAALRGIGLAELLGQLRLELETGAGDGGGDE
jgi:hypothetical protein